MLKKLIKELPSIASTASTTGSGSSNEAKRSIAVSQQEQGITSKEVIGSQNKNTDSYDSATISKTGTCNDIDNKTDPNQAKTIEHKPGEIAFFKLLHSELRKASHFFSTAEQEFAIREERVREGMEIMRAPNAIMVNDRWSLLAKSLCKLYKDLLLLETFAIMTYCSFSKILKKHDKVTGYKTRTAFMTKIVDKANFTNYPNILAMIDRCAALYEEVSNHLMAEGRGSLLEDERLFINMIHRLNDQVLDTDTDYSAASFSRQRNTNHNTMPDFQEPEPRNQHHQQPTDEHADHLAPGRVARQITHSEPIPSQIEEAKKDDFTAANPNNKSDMQTKTKRKRTDDDRCTLNSSEKRRKGEEETDNFD